MRDDRLDSLLSVWHQERLRGRDVQPAELCRDCPDLAAELAKRIDLLRRMDELAQASAAPPDRDAAQAAHAATGHWHTSVVTGGSEPTLGGIDHRPSADARRT